ncbi:MAG: glycerate kinase [Bacteroidota bacterium]|nr:glycerate kinase [Bacteroidota bacterium]
MHILIAPNAFKNSLSAAAAAAAIEKGFQQSRLPCSTRCFPVGDGGDGTGTLLTQLLKGIFIEEKVTDPLGREIKGWMGLIDQGQTAVIEMAAASGLRLLQPDELDPLHASSFGTGQLLQKAWDRGVTKIILCVGGSATVDGGTGILEALGIRFLDAEGKTLTRLPESLVKLAAIDLTHSDARIRQTEISILCDVTNPLLGEKGAAKIFGPQKGADQDAVQQLEASLKRFNEVVLQTTGIDMQQIRHGGAAGGTAAGLSALLGAKTVNGIEHFLDLTGFDAALQEADLVITGEGSIDLQTLDGKAPFGVAMRAKKKNIPVIALAGSIPAEPYPELAACFDVLLSINPQPVDLATALANTAHNLELMSTVIANQEGGPLRS